MAEVNKWMVDSKEAVILRPHRLVPTHKNLDIPSLCANGAALGKVAHLAKLSTCTTASVPDGPNGSLIPEMHHGNPDAVYILHPASRSVQRLGQLSRINSMHF